MATTVATSTFVETCCVIYLGFPRSFIPWESLVATTTLGITLRNVFGKAFGGLTVRVSILQWPLVSDSSTWGEVKFIMATLNLNRRCNPFIRWNYLFYYAYSSNFHAYRNLSKQSLIERIGPLQDRNDITIQITTSETKLCRILPRLPRVSKFTSGSFIHIAYDSSNLHHQYRSQKRVHFYFWD